MPTTTKTVISDIEFLDGGGVHLDFDCPYDATPANIMTWRENLQNGWNRILGIVRQDPYGAIDQGRRYVKVNVKHNEATYTFILEKHNSYIIGYVDKEEANTPSYVFKNEALDYIHDGVADYAPYSNILGSFYQAMKTAQNNHGLDKGTPFHFSVLFISEAARFNRVRENVMSLLANETVVRNGKDMCHWANYQPFVTAYSHIRQHATTIGANPIQFNDLLMDNHVSAYYGNPGFTGVQPDVITAWF